MKESEWQHWLKYIWERTPKGREFIFDLVPENSTCAEIGVWLATFSQMILDNTNPSKLYLIDPYSFHKGDPPRVTIAKSQEGMNWIYFRLIEDFKDENRTQFIRKKSQDAYVQFDDEYFDWIYVDGDHSYQAVKLDLQLYLPKIKVGGLIIGDDWEWEGNRPIKKAVEEFLNDNNNVELEIVKNNQYVIRKKK